MWFVCIINFEKPVLHYHSEWSQLNDFCAHVSSWVLSPNGNAQCPACFPGWSNLAKFVDLWSIRKICYLLPIFFGFCLKWESGGRAASLFCLAPVQVSIVQTGGFILCTHPGLSLLGALFQKIKIKRLWSTNGLPFKYQRRYESGKKKKRPVKLGFQGQRSSV
jgi:hypothetical protein